MEPANRLSRVERERVLEVLNSDEFVDQPPAQVYATLLERGVYLCSIATMYRILAAAAQVKERRRQARHPARAIPELMADGSGQVYTWDITKLPGPAKGVYYDAYVMLDVYSRYIVGAHVHARESGPLAEEMMKEIFGVHGVPTVVHADRGTSMTSKPVAALLADLGVTRSHSRPSVSNDNPYSEALFKTLKYQSSYPRRPFENLSAARQWVTAFTLWYNFEHRHSAIKFVTPAQRHEGVDTALLEGRVKVYEAARTRNPERWSGATRNWQPILRVHLNPDKPLCPETQPQEIQHKLKHAA